MRNFISSILAAAAVALVLDAVVLPAGFSLAVTARAFDEHDLSGQVVDRTRKGDRLHVPLANRAEIASDCTRDADRVRACVQRTFDRRATRISRVVAYPDLTNRHFNEWNLSVPTDVDTPS